MDNGDFDLVIAGGGLAGGLTAMALAARPTPPRVALIEAASALGGNHTWSFHDGDLPVEARPWVLPLVARQWSRQTVLFPGESRTLESPYATITAARLDEVVRARLAGTGSRVMCGETIADVGADFVRTAGGRVLRAPIVIDARGPAPIDGAAARGRGYQKFLGLEVDLEEGSVFPDDRPILMDATVPQRDGFRFVYVLPFTSRRLLVEDTYYSDDPALDRARLRAEIADYLRARGLRIGRVLREEAGVLPLPWTRLGDAPVGSPFAIGYRGGWYHPLTGYSFPVAVRVAQALAAANTAPEAATSLARLWRQHVGQARFFQLLTRLLFRAAAPDQRWRLLARFYRLPDETIARFYALRMTLGDRLRLLAGWPPRALPIRSALFANEEVPQR